METLIQLNLLYLALLYPVTLRSTTQHSSGAFVVFTIPQTVRVCVILHKHSFVIYFTCSSVIFSAWLLDVVNFIITQWHISNNFKLRDILRTSKNFPHLLHEYFITFLVLCIFNWLWEYKPTHFRGDSELMDFFTRCQFTSKFVSQ